MAVTLSGVNLPDDTIWTDEWDWTAVDQSISRTLGGRQIIEEADRIGGRPITLEAAWITKTVLDALVALRDVPYTQMVLILADNRQFVCAWRHGDSPPLDVRPVIDYPEYQAGDFFDVTIKLIEI